MQQNRGIGGTEASMIASPERSDGGLLSFSMRSHLTNHGNQDAAKAGCLNF
ncbi:hypothetical protein N182_37800 [Sinorhizobium sp. GL2]|nr:hypothetical protein N182_37800 [Sinorhizobium sp. GL2]